MDRDRDFRSRFIINYSVEEGGRRVRRPATVELPTYATLSNASKNGNKATTMIDIDAAAASDSELVGRGEGGVGWCATIPCGAVGTRSGGEIYISLDSIAAAAAVKVSKQKRRTLLL